MRQRGFTLIELMIVVAIVAILATIAIPKFADLVRKSYEALTKGDLGALRSTIMIYYADRAGNFPNPTVDGTDTTPGSLGYTLTTNNGEFIAKTPNFNMPPYHLTGTEVTVYPNAVVGVWGYMQPSATPPAGSRPYGDIWINCIHTDSLHSTWENY